MKWRDFCSARFSRAELSTCLAFATFLPHRRPLLHPVEVDLEEASVLLLGYLNHREAVAAAALVLMTATLSESKKKSLRVQLGGRCLKHSHSEESVAWHGERHLKEMLSADMWVGYQQYALLGGSSAEGDRALCHTVMVILMMLCRQLQVANVGEALDIRILDKVGC